MTKQTSIYKEVLGIRTGDIITTSYGTGPYIVKRISGPSYIHQNISALVIWPYLVISLVLAYTDPAHPAYTASAYINNIHQEPDGRYLTDGGDEITVQRPASVIPGQMSLFAALIPPQYKFQPGVDYHVGDTRVWHCPYCGHDFNAEKQGICGPACPHCSDRFQKIAIPIIMMENGQPTTRKLVHQRIERIGEENEHNTFSR